ncbi:MAG: hypothetical protein NTW49_07735 [Bacteroidia bacterium]|nr:hypothetical protein [Bacteroidia bacterium]
MDGRRKTEDTSSYIPENSSQAFPDNTGISYFLNLFGIFYNYYLLILPIPVLFFL